MSTDLTTVAPELQRDRWGRPLVIPVGGGKPVAYTRCTTFVGCLEDMYNLQLWQQRMVMIGLVDRPDLLLSAAAHREDDKRLNAIAKDALEAAQAHAKATIGTALHSMAETYDHGRDLGAIPAAYAADIDAYIAATTGMDHLAIEQFTVNDEFMIGGTPDRIVTFQGRNYIADLKTGRIDYGMGKIAMQLGVYAHSERYDIVNGERTPLPNVDQDRAIVIHLPAGEGHCELHWVDIDAGWQAVYLAADVRKWRARKGLGSGPILATDAVAPPAAFVAPVDTMPDPAPAAAPPVAADAVEEAIIYATTVAELGAVWAKYQAIWRADYTDLAAAKKALITGGLSR